jgi:release factor glutamine methyltransferase
MATPEVWTVGKLLTWTTDYLKKHGSPSPRLDAEVLLAHARNCERIELYTAFTEEPSEQVKAAFRENVRRRSEGTPVAYLVGYKEFYSGKFNVTSDVLIPRPETEHLIVTALDRAKELVDRPGEPNCMLHIADVGTGSGIIALSMAKHFPASRIVATDISAAALQVARTNADLHKLDAAQVTFIESDLLSAVDPKLSFDLILSNPPYVSEEEYEQLDRSVRDFEPKLALVAGPTGFETIVRLLDQSLVYLADHGFMLFELSPMLAIRMDEFICPPWQVVDITKDLAGHTRIVTLQKTSA